MTVAPTLPGAVTVRAPAKVNLELRVGPRRDDGFHDLATVFQAVSLLRRDLGDALGRVAGRPARHVCRPHPDRRRQPRRPRRPARRGAVGRRRDALDPHRQGHPRRGGHGRRLGRRRRGPARLRPAVGSGPRCATSWPSSPPTLGSDVPFPLTGGNAMGSGRGDQLAPVLARGTFHWVFAISDAGLSTPAVYAECDRLRDQGGDADRACPSRR